LKNTISAKIKGFHRNVLVSINFLISKIQNFILLTLFYSRYEEKKTCIGFFDILNKKFQKISCENIIRINRFQQSQTEFLIS